VCPFSLSRSRPQVVDYQEPKLPRHPFLLLRAPQRRRPPLATNQCPLRLPELHFGFTMLLDVRVDAIRLRSRPLMSSYSVELSWAPQRRSVASDPELVRRHLSELTTGSTPPYEPTNAADDLWSDLPPSSPFPLSFSTTNSLAGEPPTSLTPPIWAPLWCHFRPRSPTTSPPNLAGIGWAAASAPWGKGSPVLPWAKRPGEARPLARAGLESQVGLGPVQQWHLAISIWFNQN
jgi:hypothetical protein